MGGLFIMPTYYSENTYVKIVNHIRACTFASHTLSTCTYISIRKLKPLRENVCNDFNPCLFRKVQSYQRSHKINPV